MGNAILRRLSLAVPCLLMALLGLLAGCGQRDVPVSSGESDNTIETPAKVTAGTLKQSAFASNPRAAAERERAKTAANHDSTAAELPIDRSGKVVADDGSRRSETPPSTDRPASVEARTELDDAPEDRNTGGRWPDRSGFRDPEGGNPRGQETPETPKPGLTKEEPRNGALRNPESMRSAPPAPKPRKPETPGLVSPGQESPKPAPSKRSVEPSPPPVIDREPKRVRPTETMANKRTGRLAIVIDDIGESERQLAPFLDIDTDLTFSILPDTRRAIGCLSLLRRRGRAAMMHLPMEPDSRTDLLTRDAITVQLSDVEIERRVKRSLDRLPGIRGVNNHMGSRATRDSRVMEAVLRVLKERDQFFLDSRTTDATVTSDVADRLGLPYVTRSGEFLDDGGDASRAYEILLDLGREALRNGSAIAIGHPHAGTARAIERALPELEAMGVTIVPVNRLVTPR